MQTPRLDQQQVDLAPQCRQTSPWRRRLLDVEDRGVQGELCCGLAVQRRG